MKSRKDEHWTVHQGIPRWFSKMPMIAWDDYVWLRYSSFAHKASHNNVEMASSGGKDVIPAVVITESSSCEV